MFFADFRALLGRIRLHFRATPLRISGSVSDPSVDLMRILFTPLTFEKNGASYCVRALFGSAVMHLVVLNKLGPICSQTHFDRPYLARVRPRLAQIRSLPHLGDFGRVRATCVQVGLNLD